MYNYLAVVIVMISVLSGMLCISMLVYDVYNALDDSGGKMSFIQSKMLEQRKHEIIRISKKVEELERENSKLKSELRCDRKGGKKMSFSKAMNMLSMGFKLRRRSWNGKGQYILIARMTECELVTGELIIPENEYIGNQFVMFFGTSGYQCGWLASQADMLANDWEVVE